MPHCRLLFVHRPPRPLPAQPADAVVPPSLPPSLPSAQSEDYVRSRETRVFLIAVSPDESGAEALDWAMENLVEDGDEVVALRVVELDEDGAPPSSCFICCLPSLAHMLVLSCLVAGLTPLLGRHLLACPCRCPKPDINAPVLTLTVPLV